MSRRRLAVIATFVVVLGLTAAFTFAQRTQYSASAELYFRDPGLDQKLFGTSSFVPQSNNPTEVADTNVSLVSLPAVRQRAAHALGLPVSVLNNDLTQSQVQQSDIVKVTATDPSANQAARIANALAQQFIAFRREADRSTLTQAEGLVKAQLANLVADNQQGSANYHSLQARAEQLQILAALQTGNAELVQAATVPTAPSKPKKQQNLILGALLGLVLGIGVALLMERIDRRVADIDELEKLLGLPILIEVPESRNIATTATDSKVEDAFRMLRARLRYFNVDKRIQVIAVASALPAEGKSTVAWNVAGVAATGGARTLLVECDLRKASIANVHGLKPAPGLAEALSMEGTSPLRSVQRVVMGYVLGSEGESGNQELVLDVLVAGLSAPNPGALLESHRMEQFLREAREVYDFIVLDTPPTSLVPDIFPLVHQVDGIVVVSRIGRSERPSVLDLRRQLERLGAPLLGVVANCAPFSAQDYGYGSYYGYSSAENGRDEAEQAAPTGEPQAPTR